MGATKQHEMRSERRVCFVLDSPRLPCGKRAKSSFEESGWSIRRTRRISSAPSLKGRERDYRMGTEIGMLEGCGFQGQETVTLTRNVAAPALVLVPSSSIAAVDGGSVNAFLAAALTRVMRAAVPTSASLLHPAAVVGSVVGVVGPL